MSRLDPRLLLQGYAAGIFPMADSREAAELFWVEPRIRAIIPLDRFHLSRSLRRTLRSGRFTVTCDRDFRCGDRRLRRPRGDLDQRRDRTGDARSPRDRPCPFDRGLGTTGELVGGLYGVKLGRAFFGESMFSRMTDASKVALAWLVARLKVGGFTLLDCQFMTAHLASLGAVNVSREGLCRVAVGGARRSGRGLAGSGTARRSRRLGRRGAAARLVALVAAGPRSRSTGCSKRPAPPAPPAAAGYVIAQLLGQTS